MRVLPKHWHNDTVVNRLDAPQMNKTLWNPVAKVREIISEMVEEGNIDISDILNRLRRKASASLRFCDYIAQRATIRKYGKTTDSQQRYDRFYRFFKDWGQINDFAEITEANIIAFDEHLNKTGMKPYSKWNNYHRFLNSFIIDAFNDGYLRRNPYKTVRIDKQKTNGGLGKHLTPEEFQRVRDIDLPTESLDRVRDLFVFQTYTCLSYTDLASFNVKDITEIKGMKVYIGRRAKTKQTFTVPLLTPALRILHKYRNKLPIISNVKYNEYLKVLALHADIDKPLSSHWARHTGASLLLNEGADMKIVSKICGHSSTRMTEQVYAKLFDETVVDAISVINDKF